MQECFVEEMSALHLVGWLCGDCGSCNQGLLELLVVLIGALWVGLRLSLLLSAEDLVPRDHAITPTGHFAARVPMT